MQKIVFLIFGFVFGLALSRSGATDYDYIQAMFLFESIQLYGIIGSAVVFAAPLFWLLKRKGTMFGGISILIQEKPMHKGVVIGGVLFGIGWSITGMCPAPVIVNIGEGKLYALAAFAGVLVGTYSFGATYDFWVRKLGLPKI